MPKVKIDTAKARAQKRYDYVSGLIKGGFQRNHLSTAEASKKTGIPSRSINEYLENPEKIRLERLFLLADAAGIQIIFKTEEVR